MRNGLVVAILLLICLGVQLSGLMGQEQLKAAEAARELLAGGPWLTPTSLYVPDPSIAPLPVWLTALVQAITGPNLWSSAIIGLLALALLAWHWHRTGHGKQAFYLLTMPLGFGLALTGGAWAMGLALVAYALQQSGNSNQQSVWRSGLAAGLAALCIGTIGLLLPLLTLLIVSLRQPVLSPRQWLVWLALALAPVTLWLVAVDDGSFAVEYIFAGFHPVEDVAQLILLTIFIGMAILFGLAPWNLPAVLQFRGGWWKEMWNAAIVSTVILILSVGAIGLMLWFPIAIAEILNMKTDQNVKAHRPTQILLGVMAALTIGLFLYLIYPNEREREDRNNFISLATTYQNCGCYLSTSEINRLRLYYYAQVSYPFSQPGSGRPKEGYGTWLIQGDINAPAIWIIPQRQRESEFWIYRLREQPDVREVARRGDWVVLRREATGGRSVASR